MNVLLLSTYSPYKISGIVAKDLLQGFKENKGIKAKLIVKKFGKYPDRDIISMDSYFFDYVNKKMSRIINVARKLGLNTAENRETDYNFYFHDYDHSKTSYSSQKIIKKSKFKPDIIVVLFSSHFINLKNLYELNQFTKAPILFYMMDMELMTGGCHYAWDCKGYTKKCGVCPALYSNDQNDQSFLNWKVKKNYIEKTNIIAIAGSEWLFNQLNCSSLFRDKGKYKVLLPIDEKIYRPANKFDAKKKLNLSTDKKIIFFGAAYLDQIRKGFKELIEALSILKSNINEDKINKIHLMIAGNAIETIKNYFPFGFTFLGYLSHTELATAYQAADVFVCPSIEDSGPMMINQSIMCGTPVVAFEMGVALDLVITGETGYRANLKDSSDLANGIKQILELNQAEYVKMSKNCRALGLELCHPQKQAEKFIELFNNHSASR